MALFFDTELWENLDAGVNYNRSINFAIECAIAEMDDDIHNGENNGSEPSPPLPCKEETNKVHVNTTPINLETDSNDIFPVDNLHYKMLPHETPLRSWSWCDIEWKKLTYMLVVHIGALYGLVLATRGQIKLYTFLIAALFYILGGLGITAGAHRLWTHRAYDATFIMEFFLMFCNCIANQGSIYHWSRDHIVHHKYSESVADPHDARRGFFFSHMGWLLVQKQPEVALAGSKFQYTWLEKNMLVQFQKKYYVLLSTVCCFFLPAYICSHWDNWWGGLFFAGFGKYVYTLHCTWTVNSVAHLHGDRPYDPTISPSESSSTSFFSMGEGWHNYHHTYPSDYACSEFGICYRYNPTKCFIDVCAMLGMAKNRKRAIVKKNLKHE